MGKLRNCPFCGEEPVLASDFKPGRNGCQTAMVRCYNCHSDGYISDSCLGETEQDAIDRWNVRATDKFADELLASLEEALEIIHAHYGFEVDFKERAGSVIKRLIESRTA